jgi:hypothetical protein
MADLRQQVQSPFARPARTSSWNFGGISMTPRHFRQLNVLLFSWLGRQFRGLDDAATWWFERISIGRVLVRIALGPLGIEYLDLGDDPREQNQLGGKTWAHIRGTLPLLPGFRLSNTAWRSKAGPRLLGLANPQQGEAGYLRRRCVERTVVRLVRQIRIGMWLAELHQADRTCQRQGIAGHDAGYGPHWGAFKVRRQYRGSTVAACQRLHVGQPVSRSPQWSISTKGWSHCLQRDGMRPAHCVCSIPAVSFEQHQLIWT